MHVDIRGWVKSTSNTCIDKSRSLVGHPRSHDYWIADHILRALWLRLLHIKDSIFFHKITCIDRMDKTTYDCTYQKFKIDPTVKKKTLNESNFSRSRTDEKTPNKLKNSHPILQQPKNPGNEQNLNCPQCENDDRSKQSGKRRRRRTSVCVREREAPLSSASPPMIQAMELAPIRLWVLGIRFAEARLRESNGFWGKPEVEEWFRPWNSLRSGCECSESDSPRRGEARVRGSNGLWGKPEVEERRRRSCHCGGRKRSKGIRLIARSISHRMTPTAWPRVAWAPLSLDVKLWMIFIRWIWWMKYEGCKHQLVHYRVD